MYPNYPYFAVAITRTCGSGGGSYIGKKLLLLPQMHRSSHSWNCVHSLPV